MNTNNVTESKAFTTAFNHHMTEINVCLPGEIIKILDNKKRKITVKPEIKREFLNGQIIDTPIIENVPLKYTGSSKAILHFPIEVGDKVIIVFSQRSLDNWLSKGELTTPGDRRTFDISDAFAIPGLQAFDKNHNLIEDNNDTFLVYNGKKIKLIKDGNIQLDAGTNKITINNAIEDLASLMNDLLSEIIAIQTVGSPPQHVLAPASIVNFTLIQTRIALLLEES